MPLPRISSQSLPLPQLAGAAVPADIDLHGGLGEGEVAGSEADRQRRDAEEGAQEIREAAFEMGERDVAVDDKPLALVEHGAVGRVMVGAVGAAGHDEP